MRVVLLLLLLLASFTGLSQGIAPERGRSCATDSYLEALKQQDPGLELRSRQAREAVQQLMRQRPEGQFLRPAVITIPVVFHVVYAKEGENISTEQVLSQLAVLNEDFRRLNADTVHTPEHFRPLAADAQIEFCLAVVDPEGNPSTGITRTRTSKTNFGYFSDHVKSTANGGADAWDPSQYLNIWICNLPNELGYASSPGVAPERDGVVLHYQTVGTVPANNSLWPYNLGRTGTHEVGHWLGLRHIWGFGTTCNDSDEVDDTPSQLGQTQGCPNGIVISCGNGPYGNMWQNYMDYTNDACMNLFTKGQARFMQGVLQTSRSHLFSSTACTGELRARFRTALPQDTLLAPGDQVQFLGAFTGFKPTAWLWRFEGGSPATSTERNPTVRYDRPGRYRVTLTISNETSSHTLEREAYIYVTPEALQVYPNPASDFITVEQSARQQLLHVELVNRLGQVVISQPVQGRVARMGVRGLPAGMYILRISSTNGMSVKKVSIVK